jgi:haloalkane dehalogenase
MSPLGAVVRTPDARFQGLLDYPFAPRYLDIDGMRLHRVDEGRGAPVLMLHGEPTWSYLYRAVIPRVATAGARAIAPDLFGFGKSDKWTDDGQYSYAMHVATVERLVEMLDLRGITLVVHDWGGPIGLRLAARHPDRIARLVVLNTGLFGGDEPLSDGLQAWRAYVARTPDLPVGQVIRRAAADRSRVTDAIVNAYDAPFADLASKAGARAFPAMIPTHPDDPGAAEMAATRAALRAWAPPALVLWSDADRVFPLEAGQRFADLIPGATFQAIAGAGHFVPEEQGAAVADAIVRLLGQAAKE